MCNHKPEVRAGLERDLPVLEGSLESRVVLQVLDVDVFVVVETDLFALSPSTFLGTATTVVRGAVVVLVVVALGEADGL